MVKNSIRCLCYILLTLSTGCGTVPMKALMPEISNPTIVKDCVVPQSSDKGGFVAQGQGLQEFSTLIMAAKENDVALASDLNNSWLSISELESKLSDVKNNLPPNLGNDKVVNTILIYMKNNAIEANNSIKVASRLKGLDIIPDSAPPDDLTARDFEDFSYKIWKEIFETPVDIDSKTSGKSKFKSAFVQYFSDYYKGKFVDRFGTLLPKPQISRTIGNDSISGTLTVFLEMVGDYVYRTPVWVGKDGNPYYGGKPTALETSMVRPVPLVSEGRFCGITDLKADAIQYLSHAASDKASAAGGLIVGSVGGWELGLGFLGKFSIGDNQTLNILTKTILADLALRSTLEATSRILFWVPYDDSNLVDLVQQYLKKRKN